MYGMKIDMYLLGYHWDKMVEILTDILEEDIYSWTVVKNFAKRYDEAYSTKVFEKVKKWRDNQ